MPSSFPVLSPNIFVRSSARGQGPFRWVALSGDPKDIDVTDELALELFPDNEILTRWMRLARGRFAFQGLAGAHLLAGLRRARKNGRSHQ